MILGGIFLKVLLKRMDCEAELTEVKDFDLFCRQQFFEAPSSDGRLWINVGDVFNHQKFVMYIGCDMQGNFGDEHFVLYRPSEFVKEMQKQMIYGNVIFAKVESNELLDKYVDMSEEEAKAISSCFKDLMSLGLGRIELLDFEKIVPKLNVLYKF